MKEIGPSYVDRAMLGERLNDSDFITKIKSTIKAIDEQGLLDMQVDSKDRAANARKLISSVGPNANDVTSLKNTLNDPNKSDIQKENANKSLDILAKAACWVMLNNTDSSVVAEIGSGNLPKIEDRLPGPLKGLGERIRANVIDEPQILEKLNLLDRARGRAVNAGEAGKNALAEKIQIAIGELIDMDVDSTKEDQLGMVTAFLGVEVQGLSTDTMKGSTVSPEDQARAIAEAQNQVNIEMAELEAKRALTAFVEGLLAERQVSDLLESPVFLRSPEIVGIQGYDGEDGHRRWANLLMIAAASNNFFVAKRSGVKPEELGMRPEYERIHQNDFGEMFVHEPVFREAARAVFRGLFERDTGDFPGGVDRNGRKVPNIVRPEYKENGRYFIKVRKDKGEVGGYSRIHGNESYREDIRNLANKLSKKFGVSDSFSKILTTSAGHVLVDMAMSFETADKDRTENNRAPDPVRVLIHPLVKAIQKSGLSFKWSEDKEGNRWVSQEEDREHNYNVMGVVGSWLATLIAIDRSPKNSNKGSFSDKLVRGDWQYLPERTGVSWAEFESVTFKRKGSEKNETMSVAQFLLEVDEKDLDVDRNGKIKGNNFKFGRGGEDSLMGSFVRDWWPAMTTWGLAFKGKLEAQKGTDKELITFLKDWSNKMQDLRKVEIPGGGGELLGPWLRNPKSIVGGLLNVIGESIRPSDKPVLSILTAKRAYNLVDAMAGLTSKEKMDVLEELGYPPSMFKGEAGFHEGIQQEQWGLNAELKRRKIEATQRESWLF